MTEKAFGTLWTVYWSPLEHRGKYVVRRASVFPSKGVSDVGEPEIVSGSLDEARSVIPRGRKRLERRGDSPMIVEVWLTTS